MIKKLKKQTKIMLFASVLCLITITVLSLNTIKYYTSEKATVTATVTRMNYFDRSTDEKNDFGYQVFVDYTYMDQQYRDVFYDEVRMNTELEEGKSLDIEIYADAPETVAKNTFINIWFFVAGLAVLVGVTVKNVKTDIAEAE